MTNYFISSQYRLLCNCVTSLCGIAERDATHNYLKSHDKRFLSCKKARYPTNSWTTPIVSNIFESIMLHFQLDGYQKKSNKFML